MLWQLKLYDATLEPFRTPLALKLAKSCDMSQKSLGKKVKRVIKTQIWMLISNRLKSCKKYL
jgi:hypothetical protein